MTQEERSLSLQRARQLLELAQSGDKVAEEQLIVLIRDKFMGRRIGRYLHRNRQLEDEELKQEFLIGVALSIKKARLDIGDPIEYIMQQGVYKVRSALRSGIVKGTMQQCADCGNTSRLNRIGTDYVCKRCGSKNITTQELNDYDELTLEHIVTEDRFTEEIASELFVDKFASTLTPGTNVHSLFTLLRDGVNRDNPQIKNYIKTISQIWGGCSENNVVQTMNKLKNRLLRFVDDEGFELVCGVLVMVERESKGVNNN